MGPSIPSLASLAGLLAVLPGAIAGYNPGARDGVAVFWGQNSAGQANSQQRLATYCANTDIDVIPIAFLNGISPPITNFASAGDRCTKFPNNPDLLRCLEIEEDIKTCQTTHGKTILLSLGGATYNQGGWSSASQAENAAQLVWNMFGPVRTGVDRPFGTAVVDGFDFDFEATTNNLPAFGNKLRGLMDGAGGKKFYLSAAPQCVYPDAALGAALNEVPFDFVMIQFYNNWCGVTNFVPGATSQNAFNMNVWDNWARNSKNRNVKLYLGIPASAGAGGGYTEGTKLKAAIDYSKQFSSFGGVMMWDMSQLYANNGFLNQVTSALSGSPTTPNPPTTTTTPPPGPTGGPLVPHWGQCGGQGWTGPTQCEPPYKCVSGGQWWSSCL